MLGPKVLLYGSRAAAHAQQATGSSFRTVLQLQSVQSGPLAGNTSSSSSSWGGSGNQHFAYQGYTGAGRAITHANSSSNDTVTDQSDEREESLISSQSHIRSRLPTQSRQSRRVRSHSLALSTPNGLQNTVLEAVRKQARQIHLPVVPLHPPPALSLPIPRLSQEDTSDAIPEWKRHSSLSYEDNQVVLERPNSLSSPQTNPLSLSSSPVFQLNHQLWNAHKACDLAEILRLADAHDLRAGKPSAFTTEEIYNTLLHSLLDLYPRSSSLTPLIEFYNAGLAVDILPKPPILCQLINRLLDREEDPFLNESHTANERNLESALTLLEVGTLLRNSSFSTSILERLFAFCAQRGDVSAALRVLHRRTLPTLSACSLDPSFATLIRKCRTMSDWSGAEQVFSAYLAIKTSDRVSVGNLNNHTVVFDEMIRMHAESGNSDKALDMLDAMLLGHGVGYLPPFPSPSTYKSLILGFCAIDDIDSALSWFWRVQTDTSIPPGWLWRSVFDTLINERRANTLNVLVASVAPVKTVPITASDVIAWLDINCSLDRDPDATLDVLSTLETIINHHLSRFPHPRPSELVASLLQLYVRVENQDMASVFKIMRIIGLACRPQEMSDISVYGAFAEWWTSLAARIVNGASPDLHDQIVRHIGLLEEELGIIALRSSTEQPPLSSPNYNSVTSTIVIDSTHDASVDQHCNGFRAGSVSAPSPLVCYERYDSGASNGVYPQLDTVGRLINALGRLGEVEKVQRLYSDSPIILGILGQDEHGRSQSWLSIEDQMIASLAHSGDPSGANHHRIRMLEMEGRPSADSYGALIASIKNTTDDSTLCLELFEESERLGVIPNVYLYNTIISKLAKSRKADLALQLFHRMMSLNLRPTEVTYASVIGACAKVGDMDSAEFLFGEMISLPRYKPRVPAYNAMIQFYVTQQKDRGQALHYYQLLLGAGLKPTEHTYKLLVDVHALEPFNESSLESVFTEAFSRFPHSGPLWASLINAWGTIRGDTVRALAAFENSQNHLYDPVVYEALFNSLFGCGQAGLIPAYLQRMINQGLHSPYVANALIHGYGAAGDVSLARQIFDSLQDGEPGCHPPPFVTLQACTPVKVYREPSTWSEMVSIYVRSGYVKEARVLINQLEARDHFPLGVINRIKALLPPEP